VPKLSKFAVLLLCWSATGQETKQIPQKTTRAAASPAPATQPPAGASTDASPADAVTTPPETTNSFAGHVHDKSFTGLAGVVVTIQRTDQPTIRVQAFTDASGDTGHYSSMPVPPGKYDLIFDKTGYEQVVISDKTLAAGSKPQTIDVLLTPSPTPNPYWGLAVVVGFLISIFLTRWHNLAISNRKALVARIDDLQLRVSQEGLNRDEQLERVKSGLTGRKGRLGEFLFWSRGQENAAWATVHYVELEILNQSRMSPDRVAARLSTAQQQLAASDDVVAKAMAARIKQAFDCKDPVTTPTAYRELLSEVQYYLYSVSDSDFAQLTSWQNKAIWLTIVGLMLILLLAYSADHWTLFVAGAAGGFLSRLSKQVKRANVPNDYGASWSTLFLSPVLGALSGWFGVLLIAFASDPQFGLVGGPLKQISWDNPYAAGTLFGAFLLGFSERLFDGLVSKLEAQIDKKDTDSKKDPEAPVAPPKLGPAISPLQGFPGTVVTLSSVDSIKVEKITFVYADGKEAEASISSRPDAQTIRLVAPAVAPELYPVRIYIPGQLDTGVKFRILEKVAIVTKPPLPNAKNKEIYNQQFQAAGGIPPYKWAAKGLPAWLTLNQPSGKLSGTPPADAQPAKTTLTVTVTDSADNSAAADFDLSVE
jgi:hypothetical protein